MTYSVTVDVNLVAVVMGFHLHGLEGKKEVRYLALGRILDTR